MTHEFKSKSPNGLADSWKTFRDQVAGFNQYIHTNNPLLTLRRGLTEEAMEIAREKSHGAVSARHLGSEIGDSLYYLSHIAKYENDVDIDVESAQPIPVYTVESGVITRVEEPIDLVLIGLLRVCDKMNPYMHDIWLNENGKEQDDHDRPTMKETLDSAFAALQTLATEHDIDIIEAMSDTGKKLDTRVRKPHVIEEDLHNEFREKLTTSARGRAAKLITNQSLRCAILFELSAYPNNPDLPVHTDS